MSVAENFATQGKKILAIGRNYHAHIVELKNPVPTECFFFLKPTTSYVVPGPDAVVEIPRGTEVHHECELGVVIGRSGRDVAAENAMSYVAGYCVAIDYTARDMQGLAKKKGLPWTASKGFDTFCPVSEFISRDVVRDPHDLELWYKVNGEERQRGNTNLMIYRIEQLIEHCSSIMTLEEGDLILTGTPSGVGPIHVGDRVTCGVSQDGKDLATLEHGVVARQAGYHFRQ